MEQTPSQASPWCPPVWTSHPEMSPPSRGMGEKGVGGRAEGSPRPTAGSEPTYSGCRPRGQVAPVRAALAGEPHDVAVE